MMFPQFIELHCTYLNGGSLNLQESKFLKDIPVVIMSSENEPSRINRLGEFSNMFLLKF